MPISPVIWQFWQKWLTNFGLLPPEASTIAPQMDALFWFLMVISIIGTLLVVVLVVYFSARYQQDAHPVAEDIEGSTVLEVTWTIIPLILFMICFVWGALLYFRIYDPPANAMNIYVVGKQWMWKAEHPGGQHEINALHVPTGQPIQLTLISQDVFHSFSVPAFRVKREAVPGRYETVWFEATTPGEYDLFCTQYCGTNHSVMIGTVTVMTPDDFKAWAASSTSGMSLAQNGERLFASLQCNACHNGTAVSRGPSLAGVFGTKLALANGGDAYVDEAFLRQAILSPSQHVTAGYAPIMPTYQGQISEDGLIDLVEYIKTLHTDERPQQTLTSTNPNTTSGTLSTTTPNATASTAAGKVKP